MFLLSICVPTYNREQSLKRLLDTIKINAEVEIIVCDDGSTDNTKNLISLYNGKLNIKYVYQKNSEFPLQFVMLIIFQLENM